MRFTLHGLQRRGSADRASVHALTIFLSPQTEQMRSASLRVIASPLQRISGITATPPTDSTGVAVSQVYTGLFVIVAAELSAPQMSSRPQPCDSDGSPMSVAP